MIRLLKRFDPFRLLALALVFIPVLTVLLAGMVWLWQNNVFFYWLIALAVCGVLGYGFQKWLLSRSRRLLTDAATQPNPQWSPQADEVWKQVDAFAAELKPQAWPLDNIDCLLELGHNTLSLVARNYHAETDKPVLELTIPHTLLIIERASHDLRKEIVENIPFSHQLTIGDFFRVQRWKVSAEKWFNVYRLGRVVINPFDALFSEAWGSLRDHSFGVARDELHGWLLRAYVRKIGYYAVDLYSGHLLLEDSPPDFRTSASQKDIREAEVLEEQLNEPLRILVLGRANAGKSSLINALFGQLTTATDVLPDTTQGIKPYLLEREGLVQALILDTPGCDTELLKSKTLIKAIGDADLILWVSAANRPDRQIERTALDGMRAEMKQHVNRKPPCMLVALSHIDQLRPAASWQPPYNLFDGSDAKVMNIRAAVAAAAADLNVNIETVVPVCLADGRVYNVKDALWSSILDNQDEALRARLLRCVEDRKKAENWTILRKQLISAGRFLLRLPD